MVITLWILMARLNMNDVWASTGLALYRNKGLKKNFQSIPLISVYVCIRRCKHLNRLDLLKEEMVLQSFTAETDVLESYTDKAEKLYNSLGTFPVSLDLFIYSLTNLLWCIFIIYNQMETSVGTRYIRFSYTSQMLPWSSGLKILAIWNFIDLLYMCLTTFHVSDIHRGWCM